MLTLAWQGVGKRRALPVRERLERSLSSVGACRAGLGAWQGWTH